MCVIRADSVFSAYPDANQLIIWWVRRRVKLYPIEEQKGDLMSVFSNNPAVSETNLYDTASRSCVPDRQLNLTRSLASYSRLELCLPWISFPFFRPLPGIATPGFALVMCLSGQRHLLRGLSIIPKTQSFCQRATALRHETYFYFIL